jgi:uracil-DNA glycosylase family 4
LPEEIEACRPFLDEQIQIIAPKIIVTLGRFSLNKFLPDEKISQIHGQARYVDFLGKRYIVMPLYHPAAALRSGRIMEVIKEDFQKVSFLLEEKPSLKTEETKEKNQQMKLIE